MVKVCRFLRSCLQEDLVDRQIARAEHLDDRQIEQEGPDVDHQTMGDQIPEGLDCQTHGHIRREGHDRSPGRNRRDDRTSEVEGHDRIRDHNHGRRLDDHRIAGEDRMSRGRDLHGKLERLEEEKGTFTRLHRSTIYARSSFSSSSALGSINLQHFTKKLSPGK
jgi:hypothetical protein